MSSFESDYSQNATPVNKQYRNQFPPQLSSDESMRPNDRAAKQRLKLQKRIDRFLESTDDVKHATSKQSLSRNFSPSTTSSRNSTATSRPNSQSNDVVKRSRNVNSRKKAIRRHASQSSMDACTPSSKISETTRQQKKQQMKSIDDENLSVRSANEEYSTDSTANQMDHNHILPTKQENYSLDSLNPSESISQAQFIQTKRRKVSERSNSHIRPPVDPSSQGNSVRSSSSLPSQKNRLPKSLENPECQSGALEIGKKDVYNNRPHLRVITSLSEPVKDRSSYPGLNSQRYKVKSINGSSPILTNKTQYTSDYEIYSAKTVQRSKSLSSRPPTKNHTRSVSHRLTNSSGISRDRQRSQSRDINIVNDKSEVNSKWRTTKKSTKLREKLKRRESVSPVRGRSRTSRRDRKKELTPLAILESESSEKADGGGKNQKRKKDIRIRSLSKTKRAIPVVTTEGGKDGGTPAQIEEPEVEIEKEDISVADYMFHHLKKKVADFTNDILEVKIHAAGSLRPNVNILHPVVKVHIVDSKTGMYLVKSDPERRVTTFNENADVTRIYPIMTKPYSFIKNFSLTPRWEESLVFNEEYLHVVKEDVIVFFEVLDFVTTNKKMRKSEGDGWYRVAWAFLKLVGGTKQANTEQRACLQLYKYKKDYTNILTSKKQVDNLTPEVYQLWEKNDWKKYSSSLQVTVSGIPKLSTKFITTRPSAPTDIERGKLTYEQLMDEYIKKKQLVDPMMASLLTLATAPKWRRSTGQRCQIPNTILYRINPGTKGAQCMAFSNNGLYLAVGCIAAANSSSGRNSGNNALDASYPIKIYNVVTGDRVASLEGHQDLVYEVNWSWDDDNLVSASSDGSVRVWMFLGDGSVRISAVYQHPSFVYTAAIRPRHKAPRIIATGSFDGKIRLWRFDPYGKTTNRRLPNDFDKDLYHMLAEHKNSINSICFDNEGIRLYSGDADGIIKVWGIQNLGDSEVNLNVQDSTILAQHFHCLKTINYLQGIPITCLRIHESNRKILVQSQNNKLRTMDIRIFRFLTNFELQAKWMDIQKIPNSMNTLTEPSKYLSRSLKKLGQVDEDEVTNILNTSPIVRSGFSPCGYQVWAGTDDGRVAVWKTDTGDLIAMYEKSMIQKYGITNAIVDICYHPKDHIVAFCAFGEEQSVVLYTWEEKIKNDLVSLPVVEETKMGPVFEIPPFSMDTAATENRDSFSFTQKLDKRKNEINNIIDLVSTSVGDRTNSYQTTKDQSRSSVQIDMKVTAKSDLSKKEKGFKTRLSKFDGVGKEVEA